MESIKNVYVVLIKKKCETKDLYPKTYRVPVQGILAIIKYLKINIIG